MRTETDDRDDTDDTWPILDGNLVRPAEPATATPAIRAGAWAGGSQVGRVRHHNEDRWGQHDGRVFIVTDGMGGHDGGDLAAQATVDLLLTSQPGSWHDRVTATNLQVRARAAAAGFDRCGSTLVVAALSGQRVTVVGVGDSRVYRLRDGRLDLLTEDHTVRGELLAAGIDADQHTSRRKGGGLTSYLGIDPERLRIDVKDVPTLPGDRLLLCSDGVHAMLHHDLLTTAVATGSVQTATDRLLALADDAGGRDNATVIVVDLDRQDQR